MECEEINVTIQEDNEQIIAVPVAVDAWQNLYIKGNILGITDGNEIELPMQGEQNLEPINKKIDELKKYVESLPESLTESEVQSLINKSLPDLSNINARLATAEAFGRDINDTVARMNMEFGDDIYYLKETIKYFLTEQQVKDIITNTVGDAVEQMRRNYNDLFDEIDMTNSTLNRIRTDMITKSQVQSLIDDALGKIVNAEEVRY